jgi:lysophospholipase L1-like esterase
MLWLVDGRKLNRKIKLLALAFAVLFFLVSLEIYTVSMDSKINPGSLIRVACIGDSITRGTEYTIDLWHLLGSTYVVGDFGIGGTTISLRSNASYLDQPACQVAQHFEPNFVIIMLGTNDANKDLNESNPAFIADYVKLIAEFQSLASKPKLWIVVPPPIFNNSANISGEYFKQNIVPDVKQVASQTNLPLIDVYSPLVSHPEFFIDGVHPNVDGAHTIAKIIHSALTSNI